MPSETVENYLKAILTLAQESPTGEATVTRLAAVLGVTPGTATAMIRKLSSSRLARARRYGGVSLTPAGRRAALDVLRRHRLIELFLVEVVGLDWSEVHAEAERLEHVVSARLLDRLDEMLGHPSVDPHGDPIPGADGRVRVHALVRLSECAPGSRTRVGRIVDQDSEFLRFAHRAGLRPGVEVRVMSSDAGADAVELRPARHPPVTVSRGVAEKILVDVTNEKPGDPA